MHFKWKAEETEQQWSYGVATAYSSIKNVLEQWHRCGNCIFFLLVPACRHKWYK